MAFISNLLTDIFLDEFTEVHLLHIEGFGYCNKPVFIMVVAVHMVLLLQAVLHTEVTDKTSIIHLSL